jgi:hypothetical protein
MLRREDNKHRVFEEPVDTGVLSTSNGWIEKAAEQRNPRLTLALAYSTTLVYDVTDRLMMKITDLN